jgi:hypothetical protein
MPDAPEEVVSWREIKAHAPVMASDGTQVGEVVDVAALESEDIFHGVVFKSSRLARHQLAPAADIARSTTRGVYLTTDAAAAESYAEFEPLHIERVGLRGLFGWKHYGWKKSSE